MDTLHIMKQKESIDGKPLFQRGEESLQPKNTHHNEDDNEMNTYTNNNGCTNDFRMSPDHGVDISTNEDEPMKKIKQNAMILTEALKSDIGEDLNRGLGHVKIIDFKIDHMIDSEIPAEMTSKVSPSSSRSSSIISQECQDSDKLLTIVSDPSENDMHPSFDVSNSRGGAESGTTSFSDCTEHSLINSEAQSSLDKCFLEGLTYAASTRKRNINEITTLRTVSLNSEEAPILKKERKFTLERNSRVNMDTSAGSDVDFQSGEVESNIDESLDSAIRGSEMTSLFENQLIASESLSTSITVTPSITEPYSSSTIQQKDERVDINISDTSGSSDVKSQKNAIGSKTYGISDADICMSDTTNLNKSASTTKANKSTTASDKAAASTSRRNTRNRIKRSISNPSHRLSEQDIHERRWLGTNLEISAQDFLKSIETYSISKLTSCSTDELSKKFKEWAKDNYNHRFILSPLATVARWQGLAKTYTPDKVEGTHINNKFDNSRDIPLCMQEVPHLSKTVIGESGLPIRCITVMDADEMLFDFRVDIRQSNIPNSGYGAFLTFLGARKLKEEAMRRTAHLMDGRVVIYNQTVEFLEATIGHIDVSVSLKGKDLHGNSNNSHFSVTRFPLKATCPDGKEVNVIIGPDVVHDDIQGLVNRGEINSPEDGIGFFNNFTEEDYEPDNTVQYCSKSCGTIDLGRYGPFLKTDRKTQQEFNLKNFLFDFEPVAWNFDAAQTLKGVTQIIDVTDDRTGETHRVAKENVPMYVNEVGHDKRLKQNILAREKDDRFTHYYIYQRDSMSKGEIVELLSNYGHGYEGTRERIGYGLANINDNLGSDKVYTAKLKRDHGDRESVQEMIHTMTFKEIKDSLEFLEDRIIEPLVHYTDAYFNNLHFSSSDTNDSNKCQWQRKSPSNRQLLARIRLTWIGELFRKRIDSLRSVNSVDPNLQLIQNMCKILDRKRLDPLAAFGGNIFRKQIKLTEMYLSERYEETLMQVSNEQGIFHAYDPSLWCVIARNLCRDMVRACILEELDSSHVNEETKEERLSKAIFNLSTIAATAIRNSCQVISSSSSTEEEILEAYKLLGFAVSENKIIRSHLQSLLTTDPRQPQVYLLDTGISVCKSDDPISLPSSLELMCASMAPNISTGESRGQLSSVLRCISPGRKYKVKNCIDTLKNGSIKPDEEWYLLWQVIRVVHTLAFSLVGWKSSEHYSLLKLCKAVKVDIKVTRMMLTAKMSQPYGAMYAQFDETIDDDAGPKRSNNKTQPRKKTKPKAVPKSKSRVSGSCNQSSRARGSKGSNKKILYEESDGTLPDGWKVEYIPRRSSHHVDRYWFSKTGKRMRSRVEVVHFLNLIERYGDEDLAWEAFPGSRKKKFGPSR